MSVNQYETTNTQLEYKENFYLYSYMLFCHEFIEELSDAESAIMTQLSLK